MIHDSYGTHACDADKLSLNLRQAFFDQYSEDVLVKFKDELLDLLPEKLKKEILPLPPKGKLKLKEVLKSEYFFA